MSERAQRRLGLLVPIPTVCEELGGISRPTLYDIVNHGLLTRVSIGRRSFITGESLTAYVAGLSEAATAELSEAATAVDELETTA